MRFPKTRTAARLACLLSAVLIAVAAAGAPAAAQTSVWRATDLPADVVGEAARRARVDILEAVVDELYEHVLQMAPTRADLTVATIPADVGYIRTAGYAAKGDRGGGLYKRVGSEPSHAGKVQSSDGAWFELVFEHGQVNVRQFGVVCDGATNDGTEFQNAIDFAALNANGAANLSGGSVIVPPSDSACYLGSTTLSLKDAQVRLVGGHGGLGPALVSELKWDANITGIQVHRHNTTGATTEGSSTTGADGSVIEGLTLTGGGGTIANVTDRTKGHGIDLRARALIRNVFIQDFAGNGINIVASAGSGGALEGNANLWRIEGARVQQCGQSGLYVDGADVNSGYAIGFNALSNGRWGIWDSSFLGNTYVAPHVSGNGVANVGLNPSGSSSFVHYNDGADKRWAANVAASEADLVATTPGSDPDIWIEVGTGASHANIPTWTSGQTEGTFFHGGAYRTDNANARNRFVGAYSESGQGISQLVSPTLMDGLPGAGVHGSGLVLDGNQVELGNMQFLTRLDDTLALDFDLRPAADILMRAQATGDHSSGHALRWFDTEKTYAWQHAGSASRVAQQFTSDLSTRTFGRSAVPGAGYSWFDRGFFAGSGNKGRWQTYSDAAPTSGTYAVGDFVFNNAPSADANNMILFGWSCTTAGTPGTWTAVYISTVSPAT